MKRNLKKLLSVVLSLVMVFACFSSIGFTTLAEESATPDAVVAKKGPFDFTEASDLSYGNGATVENGKLVLSIENANGAAWARIPYEIVNGTEYSVRFKVKLVSTSWTHLTLKTAYAQGVDVGFEHTNSDHIASLIQYPNTIEKNVWTDIEYSFKANNPSEEYKYLGLFIQSSAAATIYIDNLQIIPQAATEEEPAPESATYNFDDANDMAAYAVSWGANAPSVADSKLNISIPNNGNRANVRFPFVLKEGKTYKVKFDLTANAGNGFGIYLTYNSEASTVDNPANKALINNYYPAAGNQTTVEYTFTAAITDTGFDYLGLLFWANTAGVDISIDNLEITALDVESACFDFSSESHLEQYAGTYNTGSATVADGKLNVSIPNNGYRINTRFPFIFQEGKKYQVKFDVTANTDSSFYALVAYNSATSMADQLPAENKLTIGNYSISAGTTKTIAYSFKATMPAGYDRLGLLFQSTVANGTFSIDNLKVSVLDADSATFDFSDEGQLEQYVGTYSTGSAVIADGKLNVSIPNNGYRINTKFPFVLKEGTTYNVKFDVTANAANSFGIHLVYNNFASIVDNPSYKTLIGNYYPAEGYQTTVEYTFTAAIPDADYDSFGLLFWANAAGVDISIDNLEITPYVEPENAYYDFSDSSDLEYGYVTYNAGSVSVKDDELKVQINNANYRAKMKFPFKLQNGETYRVRVDIKADTAMENIVQIAYAGTGTEENVIAHGTNTIAGGWVGLTNEYKTLEYTFTATCPENNENIGIYINAGSVSGNVIYIDNFYILKESLAPNTPNAPDMADHTENSVTLMDMVGYEYKVDDGEWQTSPVFTNLVQGQTYSFYQRVAATDIYGATASSEAFVYFIPLYGDLNLDGDVSANDLVIMCNYILSGEGNFEMFAADMNKDGKIDLLDLVCLKKELAKKKIQ